MRRSGRSTPSALSLLVGAPPLLAGCGVLGLGDGTALEAAVEVLPAATERVSFTDWDQVGQLADGAGLTASSPAGEVQEFRDRAFDADLLEASVLAPSFEAFAAAYGVTPLDAEWEVYGQAEDGSVALLRLAEDVDLEALEDSFADLGYTEPAAGPGEAGVWAGSPELVVGLDQPLNPVQENVALVPDRRLLVMSDAPAYVEQTVAAVEGDGDTLADVDGVEELTGAAGTPSVAVLWVGDLACADLAMTQADPGEAAEGDELVEAAGGVHPLDGLVMAQQEDARLTVGMLFETEDQASADLQPRTDLAGGPAPGQGGTFPERFTVESGTADGRLVTLQLDPVDGPVLGDVGQGPVLFATC